MADCKAKGRTTIGERNAMAKLTENKVKAILDQKSKGRFHREIAAEFGVSRQLIGLIFNSKVWHHITREAV